ncbi:Xaa-Pro aminopeptidase [Halovivax ruber XH-70]|uniref:Xaa-Pro aminopeptidase n=1 Tax=Halovivax ruber (strain DSM 18193 / JCM 13892 / XH-70) TaxID=797302 RepID=L0I801_HALRX|nr:M24 family metallopeptidase [Halovivax ruber]AGB14918.1 Xaa-Pro aminopeptidase [Halovivax ruber XH-70]
MTDAFAAIRSALADEAAAGFVHAGPRQDPGIHYLLANRDGYTATETNTAGLDTALDGDVAGLETPLDGDNTDFEMSLDLTAGNALDGRSTAPWAVAVVSDDILVVSPADADQPAATLAERLSTTLPDDETLLAPASIPHDAALYIERAGFELASSDAIGLARERKGAVARARIETAQRAAVAGLHHAGEVLVDATATTDGLQTADGPLTTARLRREIDAAIVAAGARPAGATSITSTESDRPIRPGDALVVRLAPRGPGGYRGYLARTLVPDTDGGWERRAHVAVESALRSAATMLTADAASVRAVEVELAAEAGSFGFEREATATVGGVGLTVGERPVRPAHEVAAGAVVALEACVPAPDGREVVLADLLAVETDGVEWLSRPSHTLDPVALTERSDLSTA